MRILVLSRSSSLYSTTRLVLAARARGHKVDVADVLQFHLCVKRGRPEMYLRGAVPPHYDVVIPRIGASVTSYGLAVVRHFEMMGVPCLNGAVAIARSRDKLRAMQLLTKKDIDVPITVCARTPKDLDLMLELVGGTPVIVKLQQGTQGIGVMVSASGAIVAGLVSDELTRTSSTYQPSSPGQSGRPLYWRKVCVTPTSREVARSRILMRLPAYF